MANEDREARNDVFKGIDPRIAQVNSAAEVGLDIPTEVVPLPTCGRVYPKANVFNGRETVEIRSMTSREEDILTSKALIKKGTVISELIASCLIDKSVDPRDLTTGDRNALMVAIRITGYGADYDAEIECADASCQQRFTHTFDLAALPIKRLEIDPIEVDANEFAFTLPFTKKLITFRLMTGRDEEEILLTSEKQKKLGINVDTTVSTNLLYSIVSIAGNRDRAQIAKFVKNMPARDSLALRTYIRTNEPGIVMKQDATCKVCGHTEEVNMPLGVSFLWPGAGK